MKINIPNYLQVLFVSDHFIQAVKKIRIDYDIPVRSGHKTTTDMEAWKKNLEATPVVEEVETVEELYLVTDKLQLLPAQAPKHTHNKIRTTRYALFLDAVSTLFNTYKEVKKEHQAFILNYILFGKDQSFDINLFAKGFTDNIQFYIRRRHSKGRAPEDRIIIEMEPSADFEDLIKKRELFEALHKAIFPQTIRRQTADRNRSLGKDIANFKAIQKDKKTKYELDPGETKPSTYKNVLAQHEDNPTTQQENALRQRNSRLQKTLLKKPEKSKEYKPRVSTKILK